METKTKVIKRILVGTDFSQPAYSAVIRAAMLAAEHGAELDIVHVTNRLSTTGLMRLGVGGTVVEEPDPLTRQRLDEAIKSARGRPVKR